MIKNFFLTKKIPPPLPLPNKMIVFIMVMIHRLVLAALEEYLIDLPSSIIIPQRGTIAYAPKSIRKNKTTLWQNFGRHRDWRGW